METEDEVKLLKTMGCNYIQGFYYAWLMPIADFEAYMIEQENTTATDGADHAHVKEEALPGILSGKKPHILVVEDIESNREMIKEIMAPYYIVETVCNGAEAYECIKQHSAELCCILLDLLMPVMDGFQLLDNLRRDGYLDRLPVIITTEAGAGSELRALHLGADSFVAKPYDSAASCQKSGQ